MTDNPSGRPPLAPRPVPVKVLGFVLVLVTVLLGAYLLGAAVGPVAPGMHPGDSGPPADGTGGGHDHGGPDGAP